MADFMFGPAPTGGVMDSIRKEQEYQYALQVRDALYKQLGQLPDAATFMQGYRVNESNLINADRARKKEDTYDQGIQRVGEAAASDFKSEPSRYPLTQMQLSGVMNQSPEIARTFIAQILGERENKQNFTNQRIFSGEQHQQAIERTKAAQTGELTNAQALQQGQQQFASTEAGKARQFETEQRGQQASGIYEVLKAMGINVPQTAGYAGPSAIAGLQRDPQSQMLTLQQLQQATQPQVDKNGKVIRPPSIQPGQAMQLMQQNSPNMGMEILKMMLQNDEKMRQQVNRDLILQELQKSGIDPQKYFAPWNK